MKWFARAASMFVACALALSIGPARAAIPGLPGVPTIPSVNQAAKDLVSKALVKQMGDEFLLEQPLHISSDAEFPIVSSLPGRAFHPVSQQVLQSIYARARDGTVTFPAGDYAVAVMNFCMLAHVHVPDRNKFRLTPIQGKWADIQSALFARTSSGYDKRQVQFLTWSLLAGLKYSELPLKEQQLVDAVLPDFKSRLQMSFYEQLQRRWNQISANVPGAPSFDAAIGKMGYVGKEIIAVRDMRDEILSNANNFDQVMIDFANIGVPRIPSDIAPTPWSVVQPGVYARMLNRSGFLTPGVLQIRVTAKAVAAHHPAIAVAVAGRRGRAKTDVALTFGIPLDPTDWAGYPGSAVQALGGSPDPGSAPGGPGGGGGAPQPGPVPGGGGGGQPKPGPAPSGGGGQPSPPDEGSGGGGGGGGSGGGNSGDPGDDQGDASSSCDPPANMFGVEKGLLLDDSGGGGMDIGRGQGHGIVCLLLRPFIDLAPLGWPTRGGGEIDDGAAGYSLFGHASPGHVVIVAHYTYSTTSTPMHLYLKEHVTAVIDYASVTPFCPELVQTIAGNGMQPVPGWLSGAELENRLCITGMNGKSVHIDAWVVDGDFVGLQSQAHAVDPKNFLYADFMGHM
jgi:hypothetical protein